MREVKVKIGKTYTLAFGTKALRVFERELGRPINELADNFGVDVVVALLHAGMVYNHPEVSADDVENMLDSFLEKGGDITPVIAAVSEAIMACGWFGNPTQATVSTTDSGGTPAE